MLAKKTLTPNVMAAQVAHALPARQLLTLVTIRNVLNNNKITINVKDNDVALQICAVVQAINGLFAAHCARLTCKITV